MKLISINQLSRNEIEKILETAKQIEKNPDKFYGKLKNKTLAITFFQSSTRTQLGFSVAMQKLGGNVVDLSETKQWSSSASSETVEDTLRVVGDYVDVIALRHSSRDLIKKIDIKTSIINCGNGIDEHPTQALVDLYTIKKEFGKIDGLSVAIAGDLKNFRSSHSLTLALSKFENIKLKLISPKSLRMSKEYIKIKVEQKEDFDISDSDVIYIAGFAPIPGNPETSEKNRMKYQMNFKALKQLKKNSIIMNPLPRIDEITKDVDKSKHARYFEQSANALFVRMAVLLYMLKS